MADSKMIDVSELRKLVSESVDDIAQRLLQGTVQSLMRADAEALCGASYGERSAERSNSFNGSRVRAWDTRTGTIDLQIPKLRHGRYFPHWLLEPRRRAEVALHQVIMEAYVSGISTRRVDEMVQQLGITGMDKSKVSRIAKELDERVHEFRNRPLKDTDYRYVWIDALHIRVREGGRTTNAAVGVATAVTSEGQREVVSLDVFDVEDGASWMAFLRGIKARGLSVVQLVVSDCHLGLKAAIAAVYPGASWQRCRTHLARNILTHVPRAAQDVAGSAVRSIFSQPDAKTVTEQFDRVINQLQSAKFNRAAAILSDAKDDVLAFTAFPKQHWRQIWSNNPQERLNREIRRRTDVVGIFPNRESIIRLVGALLAEQNDEWQVSSRCYMRMPQETATGLDADQPKALAAPVE